MSITKMALALEAEGEHHLRHLLKAEEAILKPEVFAKLQAFFDKPTVMLSHENRILRLWEVNIDEVEQRGDEPLWFHFNRFIDYVMMALNNPKESRFLYFATGNHDHLDKGEMELGSFEKTVGVFFLR